MTIKIKIFLVKGLRHKPSKNVNTTRCNPIHLILGFAVLAQSH